MPAWAVASRTPAIAGMSGRCCGARGEMAVDKILSGLMTGTSPAMTKLFDERYRSYFFAGSAGLADSADLSMRSIFALARNEVTRSACALRVTYCSICG